MITLTQANDLVEVQYSYQVQRIRQPPRTVEVHRAEAKTYGLCRSLVRAFEKHGLNQIQGNLVSDDALARLERQGERYQVTVLDNVQSFDHPVTALRDLTQRIKALPMRQRRPLLLLNRLTLRFDDSPEGDFNDDFSDDFN
jgi:hypothetical protein